MAEHDIIGVGPATFRLVGDELQEFIDNGDISLIAKDLTVRVSEGKVLLDHVTFPSASAVCSGSSDRVVLASRRCWAPSPACGRRQAELFYTTAAICTAIMPN